MAGGNTLWFPPAEVAGDDTGPIGVQGDDAYEAGLNAESARVTFITVEGQDTAFPVLGDRFGRTGLDAGRRFALLADQWQAEDEAIAFSPDDADA